MSAGGTIYYWASLLLQGSGEMFVKLYMTSMDFEGACGKRKKTSQKYWV